ncbi:MAG: hypothetical protein ACRCY4_02445 [Brevinema sp.]
MTAYINKDNVVVYIAYFDEDKIPPNSKGKLLFTAGEYDPTTMKYKHVLGEVEATTAEEVRIAPNAEGLAIGDVWVEQIQVPIEETPKERSLKEAISSKQAELEEIRKQILTAQADEDDSLLAVLRPKRDVLKSELIVLEKELDCF